MKRRTLIVLGVITAIFVGGAATVYSVGPYRTAGYAAALVGPNAAFAHGSKRWGRHAGGHGRGLHRLCSDRREKGLDSAIEFADAFLNLESSQADAWKKLTTALRSGSDRVGKACETMGGGEWPAKAPEKIARVETMMTVALEIMKEVRPAFDGFYATLNEKQKRALDQLGHRNRR